MPTTMKLADGEIVTLEEIVNQVSSRLEVSIQSTIIELFKTNKKSISPLTADTYASLEETANILGMTPRSLKSWCKRVSAFKITSRKHLVFPFTKIGVRYQFNRILLEDGICKGQFVRIPHPNLFEVQ